MNELAIYRGRLIRVIVKLTIGLIIGGMVCKLCAELGGGPIGCYIFVLFIFAGLPQGWCSIWAIPLTRAAFVFKLILAILIGWIMAYIALTVNIVQFILCRRRIRRTLSVDTEDAES